MHAALMHPCLPPVATVLVGPPDRRRKTTAISLGCLHGVRHPAGMQFDDEGLNFRSRCTRVVKTQQQRACNRRASRLPNILYARS
jgi:hypothetical protein